MALEMTVDDLNKMVDKAARKAAKRSAEEAARTVQKGVNPVDPAARPGGGGAPNINLNRTVHLKLGNMIRAIGSGSYMGFEAERDFGQGIQSLFLTDDHEQGVAFALPTTRSAFLKAVIETGINIGGATSNQATKDAIRSWAVRTAEWEDFALSRLVAGDYAGAQQAYRAAGEGSTGAGGALVPPEFLQELYTLSIQTSVAFANAPGVTRIPVKSNLVYFPRESVMPASAAYAEAGTISATDPTFAQQAITIKKQAALNQFSNELLADSTPEYEGLIGRSLARSVGLRQDFEYLEGDGTGAHVLGLGSYSGFTAGYTASTNGDWWGVSSSSAPGTDNPLSMLANARRAGWEPNAWIMHPDVMTNGLAKSKDGNGRYLLESVGGVFGAPIPVPNIGALPTQITYVTPPWKAMLFGAPVFMSAQIPENETQGDETACTHVYLGDFNFAHILERQAIELARSDQILFTTDQTAVRVTARSAIVLLAPAAFMKQSGVNTVAET